MSGMYFLELFIYIEEIWRCFGVIVFYGMGGFFGLFIWDRDG